VYSTERHHASLPTPPDLAHGALPESRVGYGAAYWRSYCRDLTDTDLAALLRERFSWRDNQRAELPDWVRDWALEGHPDAAYYANYWDGGVEWAFEAITTPLIEEAIRRLAQRESTAKRRLTTQQLLIAFGDRLQPAGPGRWRTRCAWHDDSRPSLLIFERGWCHCFACGAHRPVADLASAWKETAA